MKYFDVIRSESGELETKAIPVVKLESLKSAITKGIDEIRLNMLIEQYLQLKDESRVSAQAWYEQHLLVETLDANETRFTRSVIDDEGNEQIEEIPNPYEVALTARTELETNNEWLKGLRGLSAPERPEIAVDVAQFKFDNAELFDSYNKLLGAEINGYEISLTEANQNGLAAVLTGLNLAEELGSNVFPMKFKADTRTGAVDIPFDDLTAFKMFAAQFIVHRQAFFQ